MALGQKFLGIPSAVQNTVTVSNFPIVGHGSEDVNCPNYPRTASHQHPPLLIQVAYGTTYRCQIISGNLYVALLCKPLCHVHTSKTNKYCRFLCEITCDSSTCCEFRYRYFPASTVLILLSSECGKVMAVLAT